LEQLEYRGYDSYGFAFRTRDGFSVRKGVGALSEQADALIESGLPIARAGIAHTRWATHGRVNTENAHPHQSYDGKFCVVHNGVIENYLQLKRDLIAKGISFASETDTEIIAHLLANEYSKDGDLDRTLFDTLAQLSGEFGLAITCIDRPSVLIGARRKSPIAVGVAGGMGFICSDLTAVAGQDGWYEHLEEDEIAFVTLDSARTGSFLTRDFTERPLERHPVDGAAEVTALGNYPHFMLKEMHETPTATRTIAAMSMDKLRPAVDQLRHTDAALVGAGSAYFVALLGQYYFSLISGRQVACHSSDEFASLCRMKPDSTLIAVSQSGETYDTLRIMEAAKAEGAGLISINNVPASTAQRMADIPILQGSGREVCVLSTKSVISQIAILFRLAMAEAPDLGAVELGQTASALEQVLNAKTDEIRDVAERYRWIEHWFFLGRGLHWPVAAESALKFKEVSYIHAEAMPAGFLKHGTISLINERLFTVAFIPNSAHDPEAFSHVISSLNEIRARGGNIIAFGHDSPSEFAPELLEAYVELPSVSRYMDPVIQLVAGQLFAYYCAVKLGRNIDRPRALAKAVTVR
jgi:glucosamine--fructose-6-phosphate aminotransferase (isomerizing)